MGIVYVKIPEKFYMHKLDQIVFYNDDERSIEIGKEMID
jgi:hypothetical protein